MKVQKVIMQATSFIQFISQNNDTRIVLLRQKEVIQWLLGDLSFLTKTELAEKQKGTQYKSIQQVGAIAKKEGADSESDSDYDSEKYSYSTKETKSEKREREQHREQQNAVERRTKKQETDYYKILEDKWGQEMLRLRRPDLKLDKQWTNKFGEHIAEEIFWLHGKTVQKPKKKQNYQPDTEIDDAIIEAKTQTYFTTGTAGEKIIGCPFKYAEIPSLYSKPLKILCMGGAERICREQYGNLPGEKCTQQKQRFLQFFRDNQIEYVAASDLLLQLL